MKIKLITIGKTDQNLVEAVREYQQRLNHYMHFEILLIASLKFSKSISEKEIQAKESKLMVEKLSKNDFVVLLDKNGKELSSVEFANFLQNKLNQSVSSIIFVIGGAYGFDKTIYQRANFTLSLSKMTFPHQLARLIFLEQFYRAFTIMKNEKYHHE